MTKAQLRKKIKELIRKGKPEVDRMLEKAINSGAIDIEGAEDNYLLPKIILSALYSELAWQYEPLTKEGKAEVKNLKRFI